MKRTALLATVLLAGCPAPGPTGPVVDDTLGSRTHVTTGSGAGRGLDTGPIEHADPGRDFRMGYRNPGGMWMPQQITLPQHIDTFRKMGVEIAPSALADPLASPLAGVVSLGGCTGSFVSNQGLIVTNDHCAQGALQFNSDAQHNYVEDGFMAPTLADEKPAGPSQRVTVAQAFTDVTARVRDEIEDIADPIKRKEEVDKRTKEIVAACEKDRPAIRCQVASFFHGGQYELIEMLEIKDVRLVYSPARGVGNYGGEVDNWHWPRHTGDWSYFRAYVGKDGKSAEPSPDNVPYQPKHFLHVTTAGVKRGDFVMIAGYPGVTNREQTASALRFDIESRYPMLVDYQQKQYDLLEGHIKDPGETAIRATTQKQRVQNGLEKYRGILDGFAKTPELLTRKDELDRRTKAWADEDGHEEYKAAIAKLEAIEADARKTSRADYTRANAFGGSRLLATALMFARWADERAKPDADRRPGFQDRDLDRARAAQKQFAKQFDRTLDRAQLRLALVTALALPAADRPWLATLLDAKKGAKLDEALIDKTIDGWYADTKLEDDKVRIELLEHGTAKELAASKDAFVRAALRVWPTAKAEDKKTDARIGELMVVMPKYVEAMKQALGGAIAPDANSTLRITYGTVKSLHPDATTIADGAFTTGSQILAKNTGTPPFNAPKKELDAIAAKQFGPYADPRLGGDLPIDFESDLDITGGNSGSPTMNDKGELVGLAFDGNREGLASDAVFDGSTTRTIQVDARYMIWTMDLLDGGGRLISEMGLVPKLGPKASAPASMASPPPPPPQK